VLLILMLLLSATMLIFLPRCSDTGYLQSIAKIPVKHRFYVNQNFNRCKPPISMLYFWKDWW